MKSQGKLDIQYAETMENHPFGIALYRPPSSSVVRPGVIGYFDEFGSWNTIADLADKGDLRQKGLNPPEVLVKAPTDNGIKWGPKTSSNTKATKIDLSAGVSPAPGIPVTASAVYSYQIDQDVGAILLTSAPVSHERYYHTTPFKNWMKENASVILNRWRDEVKENGLWIVTSTFSTKKCAINMWTKKGKGFKVGFSADVMSIGNAGPGVDWYHSYTDEGWGEYTAEGDNGCVVFFGGLKFRFSKGFLKGSSLLTIKPQLRTLPESPESPESPDRFINLVTRGTSSPGFKNLEEDEGNAEYITTLTDPDNEDLEFEVDCEYFGENYVPSTSDLNAL